MRFVLVPAFELFVFDWLGPLRRIAFASLGWNREPRSLLLPRPSRMLDRVTLGPVCTLRPRPLLEFDCEEDDCDRFRRSDSRFSAELAAGFQFERTDERERGVVAVRAEELERGEDEVDPRRKIEEDEDDERGRVNDGRELLRVDDELRFGENEDELRLREADDELRLRANDEDCRLAEDRPEEDRDRLCEDAARFRLPDRRSAPLAASVNRQNWLSSTAAPSSVAVRTTADGRLVRD